MNVAPRLMLCAVAMACVVPAAMGNHYILPCDDDCRDAGTPIQPGMTGAWSVPGQGTFDFIVEVLPGQPMVLSVAWLTFAPQGGPTWIVGHGPINGNHATLSAYRGVAGSAQFPLTPNPASSQVEFWGSLNLIFDGCNSGQVSWSPAIGGYANGGTDIVRLTQLAGLACSPATTVRSPPGDAPGTTVQAIPSDLPGTTPQSDPVAPQQP